MTLKIKRIREKHETRICMSGELRCSHLIDVRAEIEQVGHPATLDLDEFDIDGVPLRNDCQALGIQVMNCSPYIREWMFQENESSETRNSDSVSVARVDARTIPIVVERTSSVPSQPSWTCWSPDVFPVLSELK
jgi:hypothetical protein